MTYFPHYYLLPYIANDDTDVEAWNAIQCPSRSLIPGQTAGTGDAYATKYDNKDIFFTYGLNLYSASSAIYGVWSADPNWLVASKVLPSPALSRVKNPSVTALMLDAGHMNIGINTVGANKAIARNFHDNKINYVTVGGNVAQGKYQDTAYTSYTDAPDFWKVKAD